MKVLIVGSGGREHAIALSVSKSKKVDKIYCAPGNAGIGTIAELVPIKAMEFEASRPIVPRPIVPRTRVISRNMQNKSEPTRIQLIDILLSDNLWQL